MFPAPLATGREKSGASAPVSEEDEFPHAAAKSTAVSVIANVASHRRVADGRAYFVRRVT